MFCEFYKELIDGKEGKVWWVDTGDYIGLFLFSIDKKKVYNLFRDYPHRLTAEERAVFDSENPYWADFFRGRTENDYGEEYEDPIEKLKAKDEERKSLEKTEEEESTGESEYTPEAAQKKYPGLKQCKDCNFIEDGDTFCQIYTIDTNDAFGTPGIPAGIAIKGEKCPYRTTDEG